MKLEGKKVVITGGAKGIGEAIGSMFTDEGAMVAVIDLTGSGPLFFVGDVTSPESIRTAIDAAHAALGGIDIVVASAGVSAHPDSEFRSLLDLEPEHYDFVQNINTRGVFLTFQQAGKHMVADGNKGVMLSLASIASKRATAGAYAVSKAAVWMLTRCFAAELAPHGIRVNAIGPVYVATDMITDIASKSGGDAWLADRTAQIPLGRLGTPLDVAKTALFLCSDDGEFFTGSILHPDGGYTSAFAGG
jgi:NAD(P)-dependent dehydrogenase (short-subunit alcohol dehydrogenase family)